MTVIMTHNHEKEAQDQGPDVEALSGGHIALDPYHNTPHFRSLNFKEQVNATKPR